MQKMNSSKRKGEKNINRAIAPKTRNPRKGRERGGRGGRKETLDGEGVHKESIIDIKFLTDCL